MNYLAHIHLGHLTQTSKLGNFLGDFVKGPDLSHLPTSLQIGIKLHRSIDSFTDRDASIVSLREHFPKALRRMSGVVIDVYFDYLLCRHWRALSKDSLSSVLDDFYHEMRVSDIAVSDRFERVKASLIQHEWLQNYQEQKTCFHAFLQIEKRLHHRIQFAKEAELFIHKQHTLFEDTFLSFYSRLIEHSAKQADLYT
jgi:acyl carrier protein phosphodiesterase